MCGMSTAIILKSKNLEDTFVAGCITLLTLNEFLDKRTQA